MSMTAGVRTATRDLEKANEKKINERKEVEANISALIKQDQ